MRRRSLLPVGAGILLFASGAALVRRDAPATSAHSFHSGDCILSVSFFEPRTQSARGSVLFLHGLVANEKLMDYYTRGFLALGLRVIVPDLPGHGRSPGPFAPARAESCTEALFTAMLHQGTLTPSRTILAGHSMGGAIALRLAARIPAAGVIALSPAPMLSTEGVSPEMLLYSAPEKFAPNSLILSGTLEPGSLRRATQRFFAEMAVPSDEHRMIPAASHTSLLFDANALRLSLDWAARVLALPRVVALPSRSSFLGFLLGLGGLLFLTGPLLRVFLHPSSEPATLAVAPSLARSRILLEVAAASALAALLLTFGVPLRLLSLFSGDYLASFLFLAGAALLLAHPGRLPSVLRAPPRILALAAGLGLAASLLFFAWCRLLLITASFDAAHLWRFPLLILALLPYCAAEELLLPAPAEATRSRRLVEALALRLVVWLAVAGALFFLHSGQALLVLLAPYFALFSVPHRSAMDLLRQRIPSPAGAALFGAILAAVFILFLFPLT